MRAMLTKGTLITCEGGVVGIVLEMNRCGYQYDRRWEYRIMQVNGKCKWWDEYELFSLKNISIIEDSHEIS